MTLRTGHVTSQGLCGGRFHKEAGGSKQSHRSWLSFPSEEPSRNDNDIPTVQEQDFLVPGSLNNSPLAGRTNSFT